MDDRRVADYFVVCGLPDDQAEWEEETSEHGHYKSNHNDAPITDLAVIFPTLGEFVPEGYDVIKSTPTGLSADLNHGSFKSPEVFLCYRRGRDKPPLVDVGIMYDGKEKILPDSEIVSRTPEGRCANVNNSTSKTFVTYRRAPPTLPPNTLVVTDICVIITSKLETPPHAFCVINKNLNRGLVGSDVFLCYKKSMNSARSLVYKPRLLTQYPDVDRPDFAFPRSVPIFCLPMGATLEAWPSNCQRPSPIFSTFVLTVSDAVEKVYGSAVTFYEPYPAARVTPEQRHKLRVQCEADSPPTGPPVEYHTNKCLCLLSHWPFFHTFEKFLLFLYAAAQDQEPLAVPIERMISHLLEDIPFPSVHRPRILVQLSLTERLILTQPEDLPLPRSGASFRQLLLNLGPDNSLLLLLCTLTEQKLLIHSLRPDVLTSVAEAVSMIIFPFKWQCPYIPLCPLSLAEVLHAPLPFLIGVDSRFFDLYEPPPDVNCVDLDTNNITVCEDKRYLSIKLLPKKPARTLRHTLTHLYHTLILLMRKQQTNHTSQTEPDRASAGRKLRSNSVADLPGKQSSIDSDFKVKRQEQLLELEIQEAFLRFMASVFKGYRSFLVPITKAPTVGATDTSSLFDLDGFLRSRDRAHQKFFSMIVRTQTFIRFIEVRSFVSDMDTGLTFFDECTEKVESEEEHKLLDLDDSQRSERTVFIMPPEPAPGCHTQYSYANGFRLDPALFHYNRDRPPPHHLDLESKPGGQAAPGSPMARRTKHEIKVAAKLAARCAAAPELWGKCLLSTCHSIWFIHLPSYISMSESKVSILRSAYELLATAHKYGIHPTDEVCYRVMMQLCGLYSQPVLAVKLLFLMRRCGIQPNAITYGFYNRAVLEAKWSSDMYNSSQLLWHKLRNVIIGAGLLRRGGEAGRKRRLQYNGGGDISSQTADVSSIDSGQGGEQPVQKAHVTPDLSRKPPIGNAPGSTSNPPGNAVNPSSSDTLVGFQAFDRFRRRVGSIVKPSGMPLFNPAAAVTRQQSFESSAGLLMTGGTISDTEKLMDSERLDSLLNNLPPLHTRMPPPKRNRSGSCTEISFVNNPASVVAPGNAGSVPASNVNSYHSNSTNHKRHSHHHHHHHHSSKTSDGGDQGYSKLLRSKSFAHDAQILEKLRDMKSEMTSLNSGIAAFRSSPATSTPSRLGLGGRKASLNRVRESPGDESTESSQEYLNISIPGEGGSTYGSALGSLDELDAKDGPVNSGGGGTPKRLANSSRILSALNAKMERLRTGGEGRERGRRNSVDSGRSLAREESGVRRMMSSNDSLHSTSSPSKHPVSRTLVTENDPLGALELESHPVALVEPQPDSNTGSETRPGSEIKLDPSGAPVLFDRRKEYSGGVTRSQTFHSEEDDLAGIRTPNSPARRPAQNMHRSSTMPFQQRPSDEPGSPARKSSTSTMPTTSAFRLPSFSSPAKYVNLPNVQLDSLKINKEAIENALYNFSPSSLSSRKSNEILLGGLNSLKTVATSVAKKYDELKGAISANNTPVKGNGGDRDSGCGDEEPPCVNGLDTPRRKISSEFIPSSVTGHVDYWGSNLKDLLVEGISLSRKGSTSNLQPLGEASNPSGPPPSSHQCLIQPDRFYRASQSRDPGSNLSVALELILVSCSRCQQCGCVLYDEEIMAGWTPEDSNLNTKCQFCDKATVPLLNVTIVDYRSSLPAGSTTGSQDSIPARTRNSHPLADSSASLNSALSSEDPSEPIAVPYLNPLVLRKELESILNAEGDDCLQRSEFVDQHPIIYWNLIWFFARIAAHSHLPGLALNSKVVLGQRVDPAPFDQSWLHCDDRHVFVRTLWDNPRLYDEVVQPLYILWNQNEKQSTLVSALITDRTSVPRSVMHSVISSVRCSDLTDPLKRLSSERHKMKLSGINRALSLYREILFLAITVVGRENIDQAAFDREYAAAYDSLATLDSKLYLKCDAPISSSTLFVRHFFTELEL